MPVPHATNGLYGLNALSLIANSNDNRLSNLPTPAHANATLSESDLELATLYQNIERIRQTDEDKTKYLASIYARLEYLTQQNGAIKAKYDTVQKKFDDLKEEYERDVDRASTWRTEKLQYEQYLQSFNRAVMENTIIMVLIDGDGMIFNDEFLQDGEEGGRRAASQLHTAVYRYIGTKADNIPHGARIACRIYANVRGLGDLLVRSGIIEHIGIFEDFVRGFTRGKTLFDFVDVGTGKDRADEKIIESFKMFSQDLHCRRLLFGCSHDNGYARLLEECSDQPETMIKTVLIEGVPFEKELVPLPYAKTKFGDLFRGSKIVVAGSSNGYMYTRAALTGPTPSAQQSYNMLTGLPTRLPAPIRTPGSTDSANIIRTPSTSTLASEGGPQTKNLNTWAAMAAAPAPPQSAVLPVHKPAKPEDKILRNRFGQRIDPDTKTYDKAEVDRVKKMKLCNTHFLRKACPFDQACSHSHAGKPSNKDLETLRLVARMAPCMSGSNCSDTKCIYGHRCSAPPHRTKHVKGTKSCIFGESCKFPPELHEIDTKVVKTLVIR